MACQNKCSPFWLSKPSNLFSSFSLKSIVVFDDLNASLNTLSMLTILAYITLEIIQHTTSIVFIIKPVYILVGGITICFILNLLFDCREGFTVRENFIIPGTPIFCDASYGESPQVYDPRNYRASARNVGGNPLSCNPGMAEVTEVNRNPSGPSGIPFNASFYSTNQELADAPSPLNRIEYDQLSTPIGLYGEDLQAYKAGNIFPSQGNGVHTIPPNSPYKFYPGSSNGYVTPNSARGHPRTAVAPIVTPRLFDYKEFNNDAFYVPSGINDRRATSPVESGYFIHSDKYDDVSHRPEQCTDRQFSQTPLPSGNLNETLKQHSGMSSPKDVIGTVGDYEINSRPNIPNEIPRSDKLSPGDVVENFQLMGDSVNNRSPTNYPSGNSMNSLDPNPLIVNTVIDKNYLSNLRPGLCEADCGKYYTSNYKKNADVDIINGYATWNRDILPEMTNERVNMQIMSPNSYFTSTYTEPHDYYGVYTAQPKGRLEYDAPSKTWVQRTLDSRTKRVDLGNDIRDVYDPRTYGYGDSNRAYTDQMTGQTRFDYSDIDGFRTPAYISRSNIDFLPGYSEWYQPDENTDNAIMASTRENQVPIVDQMFRNSTSVQRDYMAANLASRNFTRLQQKRIAPVSTMKQVRYR